MYSFFQDPDRREDSQQTEEQRQQRVAPGPSSFTPEQLMYLNQQACFAACTPYASHSLPQG